MSTAVQLRTIHLHGFLGKKFGKTIQLAGNNMFQLMNGLKSRLGDEFSEVIKAHSWHVVDGKLKPGNDLGEDNINRPLANSDVHILPAVEGANAVFRIILGIIILVAAYFGYGTPETVQMGFALIFGGVAEILTRPKTMNRKEAQDEGGSSIFNSARMVTTQGGPVPVVYGRVRRCSSVVISTDFSSEQQFNYYDYWSPPGGGIEP